MKKQIKKDESQVKQSGLYSGTEKYGRVDNARTFDGVVGPMIIWNIVRIPLNDLQDAH